MAEWNTDKLIEWDKQFVWHPFTDMREWCAAEHEPLVLVEGKGALLRDSKGREYIDGNSSIWTNIHGHNHPHINAAIRRQLGRVAHTSFLGFTNPAAIELARAMVALFPDTTLNKVFFSDDGSTGIEVALRVADQVLADAALEKTSVCCLSERLSWRYCGRSQSGRRRDVPNQSVAVEFSCHPSPKFRGVGRSCPG